MEDSNAGKRNSECANWIVGRGLSIACNLTWAVPAEFSRIERDERISRIKASILEAMETRSVDCTSIQLLLALLKKNTPPNWRHRFMTTNWDYLLQREILRKGWKEQPTWLDETHVYHLNGTAEELADNSNRSSVVLEDDPIKYRTASVEGNIVWNKMIWDRMFIVVGMSFECEADKFLLAKIGEVEDDLPIGESTWLIVNPERGALDKTCSRISERLPHARVEGVCEGIQQWLTSGLPHLRKCAVLT